MSNVSSDRKIVSPTASPTNTQSDSSSLSIATTGTASVLTKAKKIRVAEAVESGVEGLLRFLQRYVNTASQILFMPQRSVRLLLADRRRESPLYVLPLTFLAIGVFLLSLLGQTAGVVVFDWIWFSEEIGKNVTETLRKEFSLASVVVQAIPGMAGVLVLVGVFRLLVRPWYITSKLSLVSLAYAFGAQALLLFVVAFGLVALQMLGGSFLDNTTIGAAIATALVIIGLLLAFISPLLFTFKSLRLRKAVSRSGYLRSLTAKSFLLGSLIVGHMFVLYGARVPNQLIAAAKGPTSPNVNIDEVQYQIAKGKLLIQATMTIKNRKDIDLDWLTRQIDFRMQIPSTVGGKTDCTDDWLYVNTTEVIDVQGIKTPFVNIDPQRSSWVAINAEVDMSPELRKMLDQESEWATYLRIETSVGAGELVCARRRLILKSID